MAFQLVAGHPALDLVNTLDWRFRRTGAAELLHRDIVSLPQAVCTFGGGASATAASVVSTRKTNVS